MDLTKEKILEMPAGRELDAHVAAKVMGWTDLHKSWIRGIPNPADGDYFLIGSHINECMPSLIPYFSTDIAAAWKVVEKAAYVKLDNHDRDGTKETEYWMCWLQLDGDGYQLAEDVEGKTAQEAICRAALLAVMEGKIYG